ncbi:MAG: hypothetical protein CMH27_01865 [Micavibrio sp.]|nr:hypothetical protein [Micavibrio sp.]
MADRQNCKAEIYIRGRMTLCLMAVILIMVPHPAQAQLTGADTEPGDSCAGFATGASRLTADSNGSGSEVSLICDGSVWRTATITVPGDPDPCTPAKAGSLRYDSVDKTLDLCHDSAWIPLIASNEAGDTPTALTGDGYFVITDGTWSGDLAAAAGGDYATNDYIENSQELGDKLCLDDLTANNWMGKADATARGLLNAAHVKAFLCSRFTCNNALPSVTYYFAVSGELASGGASFTVDSDGIGPNDSANWSGATYFNGNKEYWVNRQADSATQWRNNPHGQADKARCEFSPGWTSIEAGSGGGIGQSNTTNNDRWDAGNGNDCNVARYLVCMVHP